MNPIPSPTAPPPGEASVFLVWCRGVARRLALLGDSAYRRNVIWLLVLELRLLLGRRAALAGVLALGAGAFAAWRQVPSAHEAYSWLLLGTLVVAALLGTGIYAAEQRQGTLELSWLASGTARAILTRKVVVYLFAIGVVCIPAVVAFSAFLEWDLDVVMASAFLLTTAWFAVSVVALFGTFVRQPWVGEWLGVGVLVAWFWWLGQGTGMLNPFLNPASPQGLGGQIGGGAFRGSITPLNFLVWNRIVCVLLCLAAMGSASRRLSRLL